nr:MAG TPA: hypothetical protein [Caudoviricetes sp.]
METRTIVRRTSRLTHTRLSGIFVRARSPYG